ncbi:TonB family protein [Methylobacterium sp. sgz302541]|uniref:TonB family protein n=1 Tax=unclassified Methylobacterium TaxID=2615210 RepID=UPI003D346313
MRVPLAAALGALALLAAVLPARAEDRRDWARTVSAHIVRFLKYPRSESREGQAGRAMVGFKADRAGHVHDVAIATSSGRPILDRAAVAAVKAADPVPAPHWLSGNETISLVLPVSFKR